MIKNFLIINCIGKNDKIGLKVNDNFFIHDFNYKTKNNDQLVISILNLVKKHKVNFNADFSILVNFGPGSFSAIRVSLAVAKGIKLSKKNNIFGFKNLISLRSERIMSSGITIMVRMLLEIK